MEAAGSVVPCCICGKDVYCSPSRLKRRSITCSRKCVGIRNRAPNDTKCVQCGKMFHLKDSHKRSNKGDPCCSRECRGEYLKTVYKGIDNPNSRYFNEIDKFFATKIHNLKKSAKERGFEFNTTPTDLRAIYDRQNGLCYYSGIPMALRSTKWSDRNQADPDVLSVDRIDPSKGYVTENIVLCCTGLNKLKGNSTIEEALYFTNQIALHHFGTCKFLAAKVRDNAKLPVRSKLGDAASDLYVSTIEDMGDHVKVGFGIAIQLPPGWAAFILPRSSIYKTGLSFSNSVGLIDQGFIGEICGIFEKNDLNYEGISIGDRVAQIMPVKIPLIEIREVSLSDLQSSGRGSCGFGSTNV